MEHYIYSNEIQRINVEHYKILGGDHDWPGSSGNMDVIATNEIWNFVSQYNINGLINCSSLISEDFLGFDTKHIVKIIDVIGRETILNTNQILFFIYSDGTIEKKYFSE